MSNQNGMGRLRQQSLFAGEEEPVIEDNLNRSPVRFGVIGIGGGGCNAVESMARFPWSDDVDFICIETDVQKLRSLRAPKVIAMQLDNTRGQGAGMVPDNGRRAAEKSRSKIEQLLSNYQAVFLVSGMGGGTGTGASPTIANYARALGVLVVGIVTKPFSWESDRFDKAQRGIDMLKDKVDSLILISNEKVEECFPGANYRLTLSAADTVLSNAVRSITNLVIRPGQINIDFADICHVLRSSQENRLSLIGFGDSRNIKDQSSNILEKTVEQAIENPILEAYSLEGCTGLLVNITTNSNTAFLDIKAINSFMEEKLAGKTATDGFIKKTGFVIDDELDDDVIQVTVVAAGVTQFSVASEDEDITNAFDFSSMSSATAMKVHVNPNPPQPERDFNPDQVHIGMNTSEQKQASRLYGLQPDRRAGTTHLQKKHRILSTRDFMRAAAANSSTGQRLRLQKTPFLERQLN